MKIKFTINTISSTVVTITGIACLIVITQVIQPLNPNNPLLSFKPAMASITLSNNVDGEEEKNKEIVQAFQDEIFNEKNLTALDQYYSIDLVQHNPQQPQGREGARQFFAMLFEAFPNLHSRIDHMVAEDDLVMYTNTWNATHQGEFFGIPPTNRTITFETAELFRLADNGTMIEHWDVVDRGIILDLTQQSE